MSETSEALKQAAADRINAINHQIAETDAKIKVIQAQAVVDSKSVREGVKALKTEKRKLEATHFPKPAPAKPAA